MAISGLIKEHLGFYGNFSLGMFFSLVAMFYAIFVLKDSRTMRPPEIQKQIDMMAKLSENSDSQTNKKGIFSSLFDTNNIKSAIVATFKKRPNRARSCLIITGVCVLLEFFLITGNGPTLYLYYRKKFSWDAKTFGMFIGFNGLLSMLAQFVAVPFLSNKLKWSDTRIALLGIIGTIAQFILVCFTPITMTYLVYVGGILSIFSVSINTAFRSMISKFIGPMEIGKVFSVAGAFQAAIPLIGSPAFGFIYKQTVATFPGAFLLFSSGLYLVMMMLLMLVNSRMKNSELDEDMKVEPEQLEKFLDKKLDVEKL